MFITARNIALAVAAAFPVICHAAPASGVRGTWHYFAIAIAAIGLLIVVAKLLTHGATWAKALAVALVVFGGWQAEVAYKRFKAEGVNLLATVETHDPSRAKADLRALVADVAPDDVTMYCTPECPNCAEARRWLDRHGFAYEVCDISSSVRCEAEFARHGGDGTPYVIVRGHHMKDGFDSEQFIALLRQR